MEKIFLIGATGFVFLSVYNLRIKEFRVDTNSNKFLVKALVWGMLPFVIMSLAKKIPCIPTIPEDMTFTVDIISLMLLALFLGTLLSCPKIQKIITSMTDWLIDIPANLPRAEGLLAHDLSKFMANGDVLILTLKSGKVYVGALIYADHREDIAPEEKAVKIIPWKSGFRTEKNNVEYTTFYIDTDGDNKNTSDIANLELVILQREIVSHTVYNAKANNIFGHSS